MNEQHRETLGLVAERIRGFDKACREVDYTEIGDAWDLLYEARDAIDEALKSVEKRGPYYGCAACGCTDIEYQCWVAMNTDRPTDDCGSSNVWCPQCEDSEGRSVEVEQLKPYDPEASHGIPEET